ncbi:hypothetical protein AHF37_03989 [Paragonimus kellicotti]|nr:hypothetical protein AHF37_03989 [Paragonimus kellicotti]
MGWIWLTTTPLLFRSLIVTKAWDLQANLDGHIVPSFKVRFISTSTKRSSALEWRQKRATVRLQSEVVFGWSWRVCLSNCIITEKTTKKQIRTNLRVGGAYHIGTPKFPLGFMATSPRTTDSPSRTTAHAFLRHPLNLVLAREQGDIGPCSKAKRLRYKASRWRVEGYAPRIDGLQFYGNRLKGVIHSDPQTFQESIQGSLWAVSRLHLENKFKCHRGCVNALCFNSTGNLIAADDLKVVVTNWVTKEQIAKYNTGHCMNIFHVKFIPDTNDTQLVSCACDSEVRLAQLSTDGSLAGPTRLLVAHTRACHKLALPSG